jgi:hypothetical protein
MHLAPHQVQDLLLLSPSISLIHILVQIAIYGLSLPIGHFLSPCF